MALSCVIAPPRPFLRPLFTGIFAFMLEKQWRSCYLNFMWRLVPLLLFLSSCSLAGNLESRHSSDLAVRNIRRIAVLPREPMPPGEKPKLSTPATPSAQARPGEKEAAPVLDHYLYSTMSALPDWQIVSDREVRDVLAMLPQGSEGPRARKLGELVYADAVISGRVLRYRERVGEEWGAKTPASISFVINLWDVKRGDLIWSARFDETQRPLSENIFALGEFAQRGGKWLKAEELALDGVKRSLKQLHQALFRRAA